MTPPLDPPPKPLDNDAILLPPVNPGEDTADPPPGVANDEPVGESVEVRKLSSGPPGESKLPLLPSLDNIDGECPSKPPPRPRSTLARLILSVNFFAADLTLASRSSGCASASRLLPSRCHS